MLTCRPNILNLIKSSQCNRFAASDCKDNYETKNIISLKFILVVKREHHNNAPWFRHVFRLKKIPFFNCEILFLNLWHHRLIKTNKWNLFNKSMNSAKPLNDNKNNEKFDCRLKQSFSIMFLLMRCDVKGSTWNFFVLFFFSLKLKMKNWAIKDKINKWKYS